MKKVVFDKGPLGADSCFSQPSQVIRADAPDDVPAAFAAMEKARSAGKWLAGFASYELGYLFSHKLRDLMPADRRVPFMCFGVFEEPVQRPISDTPKSTLSDLAPEWTEAQYSQAFKRLRDYIAAGDCYQANLTFPIAAKATGTPEALYQALRDRQAVQFGAYLELEDFNILSRSPELFFKINEQGQLTTRPMKGTAPRGATPEEDAALARDLAASEKNRAENLMIVDLLRNDVSRISEVGSVKVPRLFHVETYETVHQMVSDVTAQLLPDLTVSDIFQALFPCGSITGAPKIRAMQILAELEDTARDVYCGAIGWIAPDARMEFSVAIRSLIHWPDGHVRFNVGGGVVYDSTADGEYEEALWKARFAELAPTT